MPRYRSKIVEIDAILWTGHNIDEIMKFCFEDDRWKALQQGEYIAAGIGHTPALGTLDIPTMNGMEEARAGDFVVRGVLGDLYPCVAETFHMKYDLI